jgi:succinoglycan biosynthesis protein ExoV
MKLHCYSHRSDPIVSANFVNFGDDLNSLLWDELFPGLLDQDESTLFSGVGSHLNAAFARRFHSHRHLVFGTGYGYGKPIGSLGEKWNIFFVRGPLTAQSMGLDDSAVITDAAVLIRLLRTYESRRDIPVSLMPHVQSMGAAPNTWLKLCEDLGFHLIDVRGPLNQVISDLSRTEVLLTEALHGAIVADALRTPWIPFISNLTISSLKWTDWCGSVGIRYAPFRIAPQWQESLCRSPISRLRRRLRLALTRMAIRRMSVSRVRHLSSDSVITTLTERLSSMVDTLRRRYNIAGPRRQCSLSVEAAG